MAAPVTVIIAYDLRFYDKLPRLFPRYPAMRDMFVNNPQLIQETALRNSTLQGAYMILAARALGLDCGPMSGFDNAKLEEEFFAAGKCESCEQEFFPEGHVKPNFLCNIGDGDPQRRSCRGALGSALARHAPCSDCHPAIVCRRLSAKEFLRSTSSTPHSGGPSQWPSSFFFREVKQDRHGVAHCLRDSTGWRLEKDFATPTSEAAKVKSRGTCVTRRELAGHCAGHSSSM